jgi:hypothetical protein
MLWIAALALMMVGMLVSSVIGAEINYRRNLERRERLTARRAQPIDVRALAVSRP